MKRLDIVLEGKTLPGDVPAAVVEAEGDQGHDGKIEKNEIKSDYMQQAFIGNEIEVKSNYFNKDEATIMSFSKNKTETEFIYQLPFTKKRALVETTLFSTNPDLRKLQQKHTRNLKKYGN